MNTLCRKIISWVLFVIFVCVCVVVTVNNIGRRATPVSDRYSDRFIPHESGQIRGSTYTFFVIVDSSTGVEYLFVANCGAVRLEKK